MGKGRVRELHPGGHRGSKEGGRAPYDEINEQCFGISECTIFEHDDKLYLLGAYANKIIGGSYLKYERPSFAETLTVMYEIEMSDEAKKILQSKDKFYPGKDNIWCFD